MSDTWCSLAWNHHFIGPGGRCKPCCRFKGQEVPPDNNLDNDSLEGLFNNKFMEEVRDKMMKGIRIPGCAKCYEEEDSGKKASLRQIYNRLDVLTGSIRPNKPYISFLESAFSNVCDLQCVMCGPYFSTSWSRQDLSEISDLVKPFGRLNTNVDAIKGIVPDLIHMKFTGGEPMLIKEYTELLEERARYPGMDKLFLNYSTNLLHFPRTVVFDIWKKVKFVEIAASFDGMGNVIKYVRWPTDWVLVEDTLKRYMQASHFIDIRVGMRATILPYNILQLPEMIDYWAWMLNTYYNKRFCEESWINPTHVAQPIFLTLKVLPQSAKELITKRIWNKGKNTKTNTAINHLCNYMNSEDHTQYLDDFKRFTKVMDKRGVTFEQIYPELYNEIF